MITSMTGFGRSCIEGDVGQVSVEIRSVNARFLDIQIRCPQNVQSIEQLIRERFQTVVNRGKVSVHVSIDSFDQDSSMPILNEKIVDRYLKEAEKLMEMGGIIGDIDLGLIMQLPDVFTKDSTETQCQQLQDLVVEGFEKAKDDFLRMRETEGSLLANDIRMRIENIVSILADVSDRIPVVRKQVNDRLRKRVEDLLESQEIDEGRLAMEVTLIAERSDITEELVRFDSHNKQFIEMLTAGGEVGRKFNFLLQEMNREANTVSSKVANTDIVHMMLEIKEELERIREQVQNLA